MGNTIKLILTDELVQKYIIDLFAINQPLLQLHSPPFGQLISNFFGSKFFSEFDPFQSRENIFKI